MLGTYSNHKIVNYLYLWRLCQRGERGKFRFNEDNVTPRKPQHHRFCFVFFSLSMLRLNLCFCMLLKFGVWPGRLKIEKVHLFACKRLLCVSEKTPNHMLYGETGRYPLYIDSTISVFRYWFKLCKLPSTRFRKQALIMLRDSLIMNTKKISNWAGSVKDCLESCGFQDVWTSGRVDNEKAFISSFKQRMIERFKQKWNAKISDSDRFSTYHSFKSVHQLETFLNTIKIKRFRDTLIRLRLGLINWTRC